MADPRIHHYIPQAYLRGFGFKRSEKNWHVHAWDRPSQRHFQPNTKNICCERDFLKFDNGEDSPFKLESEMAKFESQARQAIMHVAETRAFEGEARNMVLNFIALLAVRSPEMRENMRENQERILKMVMRVSMASKSYFEETLARMRKEGAEIPEDLTYEKMKEFADKEEYSIEVPRERHIISEFKMVDSILKYLAMRKWRLYVVRDERVSFVTTDHPVSLTWLHPENIPPHMRHSPGYAMKDTELVFPLTHETLLHGRFDHDDGVEDALPQFAAACNSRMIANCYRYAFSVSEEIPYLIPPANFYLDDQVLARLKQYADSKPKVEAPKEMSWNVRSGPPIPKRIDAPDEEEVDWSDPKYDVLFEDRSGRKPT
jgi:hypothetical protein